MYRGLEHVPPALCVVKNALSAGTRLGNLGGDALSTGGGLGPGSSQGVVHPFDRGTLPLGCESVGGDTPTTVPYRACAYRDGNTSPRRWPASAGATHPRPATRVAPGHSRPGHPVRVCVSYLRGLTGWRFPCRHEESDLCGEPGVRVPSARHRSCCTGLCSSPPALPNTHGLRG